jgi:hypothetical protein
MKTSCYPAVLLAAALLTTSAVAQPALDVARYTDSGALLYPDNLAEWIVMGASLGSEYGDAPFDPANPGSIGMVQMEPAAYRYFLENREYADGTMFLLSFFAAEAQSSPQLPGFVQGAMTLQEIHVIDKARFAEGRAFFVYPTPQQVSSAKLPDGSECVTCHNEHGAFDGTFTQFYPTLRDLR